MRVSWSIFFQILFNREKLKQTHEVVELTKKNNNDNISNKYDSYYKHTYIYIKDKRAIWKYYEW